MRATPVRMFIAKQRAHHPNPKVRIFHTNARNVWNGCPVIDASRILICMPTCKTEIAKAPYPTRSRPRLRGRGLLPQSTACTQMWQLSHDV